MAWVKRARKPRRASTRLTPVCNHVRSKDRERASGCKRARAPWRFRLNAALFTPPTTRNPDPGGTGVARGPKRNFRNPRPLLPSPTGVGEGRDRGGDILESMTSPTSRAIRLAKAGLAVSICVCGIACSRAKMPFLGMWAGGFSVDTVSGRSGIAEREAYRMAGFLQIYAGGTFKMGMRNRAQNIDLSGTWTFKGRRATLTFTDVAFDETSVDELRAVGRPFVPPSDLKDSYGRALILDLGPNDKSLTGLKIGVGDLTGKYEFHKGQR